MRIVKLTKETTENILENMLKRSPTQYGTYEASVQEIIENVKTRKDAAVFEYTEKFDHAVLDADRKSTRLNSSHMSESRMPSSA